MLILVAVTVKTVIDSGLFGHAKNATTRWAEEEQKELSLGNQVDDVINDYIPPSPNIGDFVNYSPSPASNYMNLTQATSGISKNPVDGIPQEKGLKWQIMNIDTNGSIDLIAETPISTNVHFQGALGYNNAVYLLNDLCKSQYSYHGDDYTATARSINLFDIEKHFTDSGKAARDSYIYMDIFSYGSTKTYSGEYSDVPHVYKHTDKTTAGESSNCYSSPTLETYSQENSFVAKHTYYRVFQQASYYDNPNFHTLIFGNTNNYNYWLASRYVACDKTGAAFGLRFVFSGNIAGDVQMFSNHNAYFRGDLVRPVVTLPSTVKLEQVASSDNTWNIVSDIDDALDIVD